MTAGTLAGAPWFSWAAVKPAARYRPPPLPPIELADVLRWSVEWPRYTDPVRFFEGVIGPWRVRIA